MRDFSVARWGTRRLNTGLASSGTLPAMQGSGYRKRSAISKATRCVSRVLASTSLWGSWASSAAPESHEVGSLRSQAGGYMVKALIAYAIALAIVAPYSFGQDTDTDLVAALARLPIIRTIQLSDEQLQSQLAILNDFSLAEAHDREKMSRAGATAGILDVFSGSYSATDAESENRWNAFRSRFKQDQAAATRQFRSSMKEQFPDYVSIIDALSRRRTFVVQPDLDKGVSETAFSVSLF